MTASQDGFQTHKRIRVYESNNYFVVVARPPFAHCATARRAAFGLVALVLSLKQVNVVVRDAVVHSGERNGLVVVN